jgi:hypothetical protein
MRVTLMVVVLLLTACGGSGGGDTAADTLTQRQRDSMIGASSLPGAGGVRKAQEAADSAAARRARLDSLSARN